MAESSSSLLNGFIKKAAGSVCFERSMVPRSLLAVRKIIGILKC
jgi:hypothetical protein